MVRWTDYLALLIATLVVLFLTLLHRQKVHQSVRSREFQNRLVLSSQILLVVAWILLVLVQV